MQLPFIKMQAAGNDYIFIDCLVKEVEDPESLARTLCRPHFSVGADGLILLLPSKLADARIRIFNADGSEAGMCGNASRCAGKLIYESNYKRKSHLTLETRSGIRDLYLTVKNGSIESITVDMGKAQIGEMFLLDGSGEKFEMREINVGNDHQVAFVPDVDYIDLLRFGKSFKENPRFPNGVNTEFCEIVGKDHIKVRTLERGVGETLACGTGACAATVAAVINGLCSPSKRIRISMRGGELFAICDEMLHVRLLGDASRVFEGTVEL